MVLPRIFIGMVLGNCVAVKTESNGPHDHWSVWVPTHGGIHAMTNTIMTAETRED